jgi:hypothetical protein
LHDFRLAPVTVLVIEKAFGLGVGEEAHEV